MKSSNNNNKPNSNNKPNTNNTPNQNPNNIQKSNNNKNQTIINNKNSENKTKLNNYNDKNPSIISKHHTYLASLQGHRESNEDAEYIFENLDGHDINSNLINIYAIFDGHGGSEVSKYLEQKDRKSTRLNSSHVSISYAVFCLK